MKETLVALYRYRGFVFGSVKREFQARYRNSMLGAAWLIIQPLAMIFVYTVIFAQVMHSRLPNSSGMFSYSIYLCSGLLTWGLFVEIVNKGQNVFIEHANLLKKMNFPRLCLPVVIGISAFLNFAIIFGLFTIFLLLSGNFPGISFVALFPILLLQIALAMGLGVTLGVLNVFFRDVGQLVGIALQFWFWLTPIVYPSSILPAAVKPLLELNPMADLMSSYQTILVEQKWPDWSGLWYACAAAALFLLLGTYLFRRHAAEMVDEL